MEEILLRHRTLIDAAIDSLEETTPIEHFLRDLAAHVTALQLQEPSFWELEVVEYIHKVINTELKESLRNGGGGEIDRVKETIQHHLHAELRRLLECVRNPEHGNDPQQREHFMTSFWQTTECLLKPKTECEERVESVDDDGLPEHASYEAITFDDLNLETGSLNSAPSTEEIPTILEHFRSPSSEDRHAALQRLVHMSPLEVVHSSLLFVPAMQGLCGLLMDPDLEIAKETLQLLYSVICHIDDPAQFLDLYFVVVDWVGASVSSTALGISTTQLFSEDVTIIRAIDAFRLFHLMIYRIPYHWIHYSTEILARVICSTLVVFMLDPPQSNHKVCRPVDVLGVIDQEAKWFAKWTLKVPSRAQLFVNLDDTGFLSDLMYHMTRIRPFETGVEPFEQSRTMNSLAVLSIVARFHSGRTILRGWTKVPAHFQQQRLYTEWLGVEKQFRLDPVGGENDVLYAFNRLDRTIAKAHGMELEDGGPLGDQAIMAVVLCTIVMYLLESSNFDSIQPCLKSSCQTIVFVASPHEILTQLIDFVARCGLEKSQVTPFVTNGTNALESHDPWFPFRRPKTLETVAKIVVDATVERGICPSASLTRRCTHVFECLIASAAMLSRITPRLASALAMGMHGYLEHYLLNGDRESAFGHIRNAIVNLHHLFNTSPSTMGRAFADRGVLSTQLLDVVTTTTDSTVYDTVFGLVLALARSSFLVSQLVSSGLWRKCISHYLDKWRTPCEIDVQLTQLLLLPSAANMFFQSKGVEKVLTDIEHMCAEDLGVALAINSPPSEAPIHLRQIFRTIATIRATVGSQFAATLFTTGDTALYRFLTRSVQRHRQETCRPNPQNEDLCAITYDLLTAMAGCIPSMVGFYELLVSCEAGSLLPDDNGISPCSFQARSMSSSLAHVGGFPSHWVRPRPIYEFDENHSPEEDLVRIQVQDPSTYLFSTTTNCALDQMLASIEESKHQLVPLDMVMLSQATWEILMDIEKVTTTKTPKYRALTHAFGKLIYALVMSGQSKLNSTEARSGVTMTPSLVVSVGFPSDAERKLMNTYYKDYCSRLGLKASPTMLHVLSKLFGRAAVDCFSCTMLIILDQVRSENEVIEFLQYCASCPSIYVLWPRILDIFNEHDIPVLIPVAQAAELVLENEFPQIFTTLQQCNCSVLTLVLRWHSQCYWNYLPWDIIVIMVYLSFLYGVEFQVYVFVALVKHYEPTMRMIIARNRSDPARAYVEILQTPIEGFRFHPLRNYFLTLRSTYHDRIQEILRR